MEFQPHNDILNRTVQLSQIYRENSSILNENSIIPAHIEGKHGHERYGADGIVFHKDTIILISSMIIMIIVGKL